MATKTLTLTSGLVTQPGVLSRDEASLSQAVNADLSAPGTIAKRRGHSSRTINSFSGTIYSVMSSQRLDDAVAGRGVLLATGSSGGGGASTLRYGQRGGSMTVLATPISANFDVGALYPGRRPRLASAPGNAYDVCCIWDRGAARDVGQLVPAYSAATESWLGVPRGMGLDRQNTTLTGASGFLNAAFSVRYAAVFINGNPDANGAQVGAPGMTTVVENTAAGSRNVQTRVLLPRLYNKASTALPADTYTLQVYRSAQQSTTLGEPPSELALVFQKLIDATDITNGYVAFTDVTPDALRGANLYTNSLSGEDGFAGRGFVNSNEPPPASSDVTTWADCLWLSDLLDHISQEAQLISVGGSGLVATDTVTIDGVTLLGIVPGVPAANEFVVVTTGSASFNARETALNIVDAFNRSASNTTGYAYYISGQAGLPGRIVVRGRERATGGTFTCSRAGAFRIGTAITDETPNGVAFSKPLEAYAFPVVNRFEVGSSSTPVLRIVPYRDGIFVFKPEGVWRIVGTSFRDFTLTEFDLTFRLLARESVVVIDDALYAWGREGIAKITDGGVEYIDLPIRDRVQVATVDDTAPSLDVLQKHIFATADFVTGNVVFWYPSSNTSPVASNSAFVFNARTNLWSTWFIPSGGFGASIGLFCGTTNVNDGRASYGLWQVTPASGAWLWTQRRAFDSGDFADPDMSNAAAPTMADSAITLSVGWRPIDAPALGGCQWLRTRLEFAAPQATIDAPPTAPQVAYSSDFGNSSAIAVSRGNPDSLGSVPAVYIAPVPTIASRSHALEVFLLQNTISEGCWVVGVSVDYRPYSTKGLR